MMKRATNGYTLSELLRSVRVSWTQATSVSPEKWSPKVPSTGQCAVTALVLQDFLGGRIMRCDIEGDGSHYWIVMDEGQEIDITADQFGGREVRLGSATIPREKLLDSPNTTSRYRILLKEVRQNLRKNAENIPTGNMRNRG